MRSLIVDDSLSIRLLISSIAKKVHDSIEIVHCASAEEALDHLNEKFDYYTLDYTLPQMTGIELAKAIKECHQDANIVLVTANKQASIRERCQDLDIKMIVKPDINEPLHMFFAEE